MKLYIHEFKVFEGVQEFYQRITGGESEAEGVDKNYPWSFYRQCYSLAAAGSESATWPPLPPLGCRGEWKETDRN